MEARTKTATAFIGGDLVSGDRTWGSTPICLSCGTSLVRSERGRWYCPSCVAWHERWAPR